MPSGATTGRHFVQNWRKRRRGAAVLAALVAKKAFVSSRFEEILMPSAST
jgi:hypothetical protein